MPSASMSPVYTKSRRVRVNYPLHKFDLVYRVNVKGHDVKRWPKTDTALGIYHFYKRCIVGALPVCRKRILWRNRRPIQYGFGDVTKDFEYILKCLSIIYKSYYWLKLSFEVIPRFLSESSLRRGLRAWSIITGAKTCKTEKKKKKEKRKTERKERTGEKSRLHLVRHDSYFYSRSHHCFI